MLTYDSRIVEMAGCHFYNSSISSHVYIKIFDNKKCSNIQVLNNFLNWNFRKTEPIMMSFFYLKAGAPRVVPFNFVILTMAYVHDN